MEQVVQPFPEHTRDRLYCRIQIPAYPNVTNNISTCVKRSIWDEKGSNCDPKKDQKLKEPEPEINSTRMNNSYTHLRIKCRRHSIYDHSNMGNFLAIQYESIVCRYSCLLGSNNVNVKSHG